MRFRRQVALPAVLVTTFVVAGAVPAQATAPGVSGNIVFQRYLAPENTQGSIFTVRSNGHDLRQITPWDLDTGDGPDISPDGTRVLFRFPAHGGFEGSNLATMNLDGTDFRQLTHTPPGERMLSASYSPDGKRITFARDGIDGLPDVWTMNTDGSDVRRVTDNPLWDSGPDWGAR